MNTLPQKISIIICLICAIGLFTDTRADDIYQDYFFFSIGSGSGENATRAMSVVTGQAVSSEAGESDRYKQMVPSELSLINTFNRAPIINIQSGFHLNDIYEDPIDNKGNSITEILDSNISFAITDINTFAKRGMAITYINHLNGQWAYTTDGQNWAKIENVSDDSALLLAANNSLTRIRFVPDTNHSGTDNGTITFRAWDQSRDRENGSFANTQNNGGAYAFSEDTGTVTIKVININDAPTANAGSNYTSNEGSTGNLNGSLSEDIDDGIASYSWIQTSGISVELLNQSSATPSFTLPEIDSNGAFLTFQLTVSDHNGLTNVDSITVYIVNVLKEFTIKSTALAGGTISPDGDTTVLEGKNQIYQIEPLLGYQIDDIVVDGNSKGPKNTYTFWDVNANHTIETHFKEKPSIDASAGENGAIAPSGKIYVNEGDFQLFQVTADEGYKIDDVKVNNESIGPVSSHYFKNVVGNDNTIIATFKQARFEITASSSENGSIEPSGLVYVTENNDQTFNIVPSDGYEVESVSIDGKHVGIINTYTFYNVTANHTMSAAFRKKLIISASVTGNGIIEPSGNVPVGYDSSQAFTMVPSEGYLIKDVLIDSISMGPKSSYMFSNIQKDHQISVIFGQPTITATASANGQITPSGKFSVPSNSDQTFTITPIKDYEIDDVQIDGISLGAIEKPTMWNISDDHTIHAIFTPLPKYQITATANTGGKIESEQGESPLEIIRGGFAQFKITPDNGYEIEDVLINGRSLGIITQYLFNDIQENHSIQVIFKEIITYTITATASEGGQISPAGNIVLQEGGYQLFNIIANEHYRLTDVQVDQKSVGPINSYAFTGDKDHTIQAFFEKIIIRSIRGRVIGEDIQDEEKPGLAGYRIEVRQDGVFLADATTDLNGYYTVTGFSPESNLIVSAWPPMDNNVYRRMFYNQQASSQTANPVSLVVSDLSQIDFILPKNYQEGIQGRVHDGNTQPKGIPYVAVDVFSQKATFGKTATTDEQGYYTIIGLKPANDYRVSAFSNEYNMEFFYALPSDQPQGTVPTFSVFSYDEATSVTPTVPATQHIDIIYSLNQGESIGGQVFLSDGSPAEGIKVNAWSDGLAKGNMATTDAFGYYTITGLEKVLASDAETNGYIVEIQPENYPYQAYNGASQSADATKVETDRKDIHFYLRKGVTVRGKVTNSLGSIVPDVIITAWSASEPELKRMQTLSDETGAYTLVNLPVADDYILAAFPSDYQTQYYDGQLSDTDATQLDLRYADQLKLDFILDKGHLIAGQVFIEEERGSSGIPVYIWSESKNSGGTVLTDANGRYELIGLDQTASDYIVSIRTEGYPPAFFGNNFDEDAMNDTVYNRQDAVGIAAVTFQESSDINIRLVHGTMLTGRISYNDESVADAKIEVWSSENGGWGQAVSTDNETINYTISGLAPAVYHVKVTSDRYAETETEITLKSENNVLDITLQKPERTISGYVAGLAADTSVRLNAWSVSVNAGKSIMLIGNDNVQTYVISGLKASSDYRVEALSDSYYYQVYKEETQWDNADFIDLSQNNQENIDFSLEKLPQTATISGEIVFPGDAQAGDKLWIQIQSQLLDVSKDVQVIYENAHTVNYSISGLLIGNDYIAAARSDTFLDQYYDHVDIRGNAAAIDVSNNPYTINFNLSRGRFITGQILNETGNPLTSTTVEVWSKTTQSGAFAETDESGIYRITGLKQSNDFIVWVNDATRGEFYYDGVTSVRDSSKATPVNTVNNDQTDINISTTQTYSIQGRVSNTDGQVLEGVWVAVESLSSEKGGGVFTLSDGTYVINGLTMGNDYKMTVTPKLPYIVQEKENISAGAEQVNFFLQAQEAYQLSGIIYASNGKPLEGAKVEIQSSTDKDKYALVQTNKSGVYLIDNLPQANDYFMNVWPPENSTDAFYSQQSIQINEDTVKDINLEPALKISGSVENKANQTLPGVKVSLFSANANFWKEIDTDENGAYEFNNIANTSDYVISASADHYIREEISNVTPGTYDFVLKESGSIFGYVRDKSSGTAMASVSVEIFSESMQGAEGFGGVATTDDTGFFNVPELKSTDEQGYTLTDYVVAVYPTDYPSQSKGGKSVGDTVEFLMSKSSSNIMTGTVEKTNDKKIMIDLFSDESVFLKTFEADNAGHFTATGLSSGQSYKLQFISEELGDNNGQWASAVGTGITDATNAGLFQVGDSIHFTFSPIQNRKRKAFFRPGAVQSLRSTTHPYVKITRRRAKVETSGQVSNKSNVTMEWQPPADIGSQNISGYFSEFSTNSYDFTKFNTADKPPVRTRKITSKDLEGDDVNYYFNVATVDKDGRVGQTTSIAFRIDTTPPRNVSVIPPILTSNRNVSLKLGATGASEMYISNISYSEGGTWELRSQERTWQLPEGSGIKKVYVRYRDKAQNTADASGMTTYEIPIVMYTIDATFKENGRLEPSGMVEVEENQSQTFTIIPDDGYRVDVLVDDAAINLNELSYTFKNVNANHSIEVEFKEITHRISVTKGENGAVTPAKDIINVNLHEDQTLKVTPNPEYGINQVLIDGNPVQLVDNTYTFENVIEDHTFIVTFEKKIYITATSGENGKLAPTGSIPVAEGGFQVINIIPDPGYEIDTILVNDTPVTVNGNVHTFMNVENPETIHATFRLTQFTILPIAGANGSISPETEIAVIGGEEQLFTFTPNSGYEIDQVLIDDQPVEITDLQYLFPKVVDNHTIVVSFSKINTPPVANDTSVYTEEDVKVTGFMEATDIDGDSLTYQVTKPGSLGRVHFVDETTGEFIYTPKTNKFGTDTISFTASDGKKTADPATITVYIDEVNDVPKAYPDRIEINEAEIDITLKAIDMDGDALTYKIVNPPNRGELSGHPPNLVYKPFDDTRALDFFSFTASDSESTSDTATVTIIIGEPDAQIHCDEDTLGTYIIESLPDDTFTITTPAEHGKVTGIGKEVFYMPEPDFYGFDKFDYSSPSMPGNKTLNIYVRPIKDAPRINMPSSLTVLEGESLPITVIIFDVDGDPLETTVETPPNGEWIDDSVPTLIYKPLKNFSGQDLITILSKDAEFETVGTIDITVIPKNVKPKAFPDKFQVNEDMSLSGSLRAEDANNDDLNYVLKTSTGHGKVTITNRHTGTFTYTPNPNYAGPDEFSFVASDGKLESDITTIIINVFQVYDRPIAIDGQLYLFEDEDQKGKLQSKNIDDIGLIYKIFKQGQRGTATITNHATGEFMFSPNDNQNDEDHFEFMVTHSENRTYTSIARVDIYFTPVNDPPVVSGNEATTDENTPVTLTLMGEDIDNENDTLQFNIVQIPSRGKYELNGNQLIYTPNKGFWGEDHLKYTANDGEKDSNEAIIRFFVGVDKADIFTEEDQPIAFVLPTQNQTGNLTYKITTSPENGQLIGLPPNLTYAPNANFNGIDSIHYTINDGIPVALKIYVKPVNDKPVIAYPNRTIKLLEDTETVITLITTDVDQYDKLSYSIDTSPSHGVLSQGATSNSFVYSPHLNYSGQDKLIYQVTDGTVYVVDELILEVQPVNDPPIATPQTVYALEETPIRLNLSGTDIELDQSALINEIVTEPLHGTISSSFIYTPNVNYFGSDFLKFRVFDGQDYSEPVVVDIKVKNINDPPIVNKGTIEVEMSGLAYGKLQFMDPDNDILVSNITSQGTKGMAVISNPTNGEFMYFADLEKTGEDVFEFTVNDSKVWVKSEVQVIIKEPLVSYAELNLTLSGDYINGDPYEYKLLMSETGKIYREEINNTANLSIQVEKGKYRLVIIAKSYQPFEFSDDQDSSKIIEITQNAIDIQAKLNSDPSFDPDRPTVEVTHTYNQNGFEMHVIRKNFNQFRMNIVLPDGTEKTVNQNIYTRQATRNGTVEYPYTYTWTTSDHFTSKKTDEPGQDDTTYTVEFKFYDTDTSEILVDTCTITYIVYGSPENEAKYRLQDEKHFEDHYGEIQYIATGESIFYPLLGTTIHVWMKDLDGNNVPADIIIPPIPLEYLFVEEADILKYDSINDTYDIDLDNTRNVTESERLRVKVTNYTFGEKAPGTGVSVQFFLNGSSPEMPVHYNPILNNSGNRLSDINIETPPLVILPILLNPKSVVYSSLMRKENDYVSMKINEKGDGIHGFHTENLEYEPSNSFILIKTPHLSALGLDVSMDVPDNKSIDPYSADAPAGSCFVGAIGEFSPKLLMLFTFWMVCFCFFKIRAVRMVL